MKKFLNALKKELVKLKFSKQEIDEILDDHKEMIEVAKAEGVSDEELTNKFGDPQKLAKDLVENRVTTTISELGGVKMKDYLLSNTFPVLEKEFDIKVALISEDIKFLLHDQDQIEVHYKNIQDIEDYTISFDGKLFEISRNRSKGLFSFNRKSGKFIVKVPKGIVSKQVNIVLVSGNTVVENVTTDDFTLKSTSGDVELLHFTATNAVFSTVSGDVDVKGGETAELKVSMVSGDCELTNVQINGLLDVNSVSGDLDATNVKSGPLKFKTVSGDCDGNDFYPENITFNSVSGDCKIKNSDTSVQIEVLRKKTLSGTVKIN